MSSTTYLCYDTPLDDVSRRERDVSHASFRKGHRLYEPFTSKTSLGIAKGGLS